VTKYSQEITLNDSEFIMMKEALELMIANCQNKINEGEGAPYHAHLSSAQSVLSRLGRNRFQISGNNFFDNK
jgi:hypothetical protein